jgi:hypothetical protein
MGMITKTQAAKIMGIPVQRFRYFYWDEFINLEELRMLYAFGKVSREYFTGWWEDRGPEAPPFRVPKNDREDCVYTWIQEMPEFQEVRKNLISAGWIEANCNSHSYYFRGKSTMILWGYHIDRFYDEGVVDRGGNCGYCVKGPVWNYSKFNVLVPDFENPGDVFTHMWGKIKDKKRPSIGNQTFEEWAFTPIH